MNIFACLFKIGAILVGIILLIGIVLFSIWRWQLRQDINARISAIKTAGLPLNWDDLAKWPATVPDNENAALIYSDAIAELDNNSLGNTENIFQFRRPLTEKTRALFEQMVLTNRSALETIKQVTNAVASRYPIDYSDGPTAQLPHLAGLKKLAYVVACDAILEADATNAAAASEDIQSSLKISQSLDNEPFLISQLVSAAVIAISTEALDGVLCRASLSDRQLSALESQFSRAEATNRFLTAFIGERAMYNEYLRLAQDDVRKMVETSNRASSPDDQTEVPVRNPGAGWRLIGFWERDRNFYLGAMATNIFFIQQGPPASLLMLKAGDQLREEAEHRFYIMSAMALPVISGAARRDASMHANLRNAITALALERWRLAHQGALPDSLNDLVPAFLRAIPADPFDGKPLRYKKTSKGYCIYSIGPDLKDDGGKEIPSPSARVSSEERRNYDIVFIVEHS